MENKTKLRELLGNILHVASYVCQTPAAHVLCREGSMNFNVGFGWELPAIEKIDFLYQKTIEQNSVLWLEDIQEYFQSIYIPVNDIENVKFWAGVALFDACNQKAGILCVFDASKHSLDSRHKEILMRLKEQIDCQLNLYNEVIVIRKNLLDMKEQNYALEVLDNLGSALSSCTKYNELRKILSLYSPMIFPKSYGYMKISKRPNQELKDFFDWGDPLEQETVKFDEYPLILERMILGKVYLPENYLISLPKYFDSLLFPKWLEQISRTLYNIMLFESLRTENVTDPLTGLFNRRYMGNVLNRLTQSTQSDYSIGIMFLDIDYFKRINDEFGHAAGDSVLKDFSIFLKSNIRPTDIACRYGGEEFAVILPGTAPLIVEKKANRICRGLRYLIMRHEQTRIGHITVSIGVAIFPRHGSTATAVLAAADQALYSAKAGGRNQVISAET